MANKIRVTILDDHQNIIDGYLFRLRDNPQVEVVATLSYGDVIEPSLVEHPSEVSLLDVNVPTSNDNPNPYPILYAIPSLLQLYPDLAILVISMYNERRLDPVQSWRREPAATSSRMTARPFKTWEISSSPWRMEVFL